tara:strand:+ start:265 stop:429 length:165 start_codon:yes stop_codon:yes gene_type:complete
MKRLTKLERKKLIEEGRKNGWQFDSGAETLNGGEKIERLPTMDEQEGTFNSDNR